MTQKEEVHEHLMKYGSITSWEAIKEYGITRISACIYSLKKEGLEVESETIPFTNKHGERHYYVKYKLKEHKNDII